MKEERKNGFQDKLTRMVGLLRALNLEVSSEFKDESDKVSVIINPDGSGSIVARVDSMPFTAGAIYRFETTEELMEYLEGGQLKRLVMQSC
jgi:hypothetical protein